MTNRWQAQLWVAALLFSVCSLTVRAADPSWIEYGPDGPIARTIVTSGGACPEIEIDGHRSRMRVHSEPAKHYEVTVCQAAIPHGARVASIGDHTLPVAKLGRATKVAILGDTGCRRKVGSPVQDCDDPKAWPFAEIAASIAKWDPDVVLHVGDYYYREAVCKGGKCTPSTYNWKRWNADFFHPAEPLLHNAPWVLVRGNHEECSRAAEGWVRFLEPRNYLWENGATCKSNLKFTPPYSVSVGDLNVVVMDSSAAKESSKPQEAIFAAQLGLLQNAKPNTWLMLHHPFWAVDYGDAVTETLWTAWQQAGSATATVSLLLTGHVHLLEAISFTDNGVPIVVAGNGGTALDPAPTLTPNMNIGGRIIKNFTPYDQFGFITAIPTTTGWTFDLRDTKGESKAKCGVTATSLVCD